jgi:hypothetical protein
MLISFALWDKWFIKAFYFRRQSFQPQSILIIKQLKLLYGSVKFVYLKIFLRTVVFFLHLNIELLGGWLDILADHLLVVAVLHLLRILFKFTFLWRWIIRRLISWWYLCTFVHLFAALVAYTGMALFNKLVQLVREKLPNDAIVGCAPELDS